MIVRMDYYMLGDSVVRIHINNFRQLSSYQRANMTDLTVRDDTADIAGSFLSLSVSQTVTAPQEQRLKQERSYSHMAGICRL